MSVPSRFGPYLLVKRIAAGGMAELFLADRDGAADGVEKRVVIKRMLPHLAQDEEFIELFLNEARLASLLNHSSLVRVYDLGRMEETLYLVMEYVDGKNLRQIGRMLRQIGQLMDPRLAAAICARVADGLDYAHRLTAIGGAPLGLVHRDISPDNILLSRDGYVKIADFGIAKAFAQNPVTRRPGRTRGKVGFMSPEQVRGDVLDGRSDLFSLGVVLYALSTGRAAFGGTDDVVVLQSVLRNEPTPPSRFVAGYPAELQQILRELLAKERTDRPADGASVSARLDDFVRHSGPSFGAREVAAFLEGLELEHARVALGLVPPGRRETLDEEPAFLDTMPDLERMPEALMAKTVNLRGRDSTQLTPSWSAQAASLLVTEKGVPGPYAAAAASAAASAAAAAVAPTAVSLSAVSPTAGSLSAAAALAAPPAVVPKESSTAPSMPVGQLATAGSVAGAWARSTPARRPEPVGVIVLLAGVVVATLAGVTWTVVRATAAVEPAPAFVQAIELPSPPVAAPPPAPTTEAAVPEPAPTIAGEPAARAPDNDAAPPESTPMREAAPPESTPKSEAAPPESPPKSEGAPPEPKPKREASPPEPKPKREAAPPEPKPKREASPPGPTPQSEAAPPGPTPQREAAPPEPTPQSEAAPPEPTPKSEGAPPEPTPKSEGASPNPAPKKKPPSRAPPPKTEAAPESAPRQQAPPPEPAPKETDAPAAQPEPTAADPGAAESK